MANTNNPVVNSLTFVGSLAEQATIQAQGIAGGFTLLLPNIPPIVGQVVTATAVNGNNVFLGWTSPGSDEISTGQLASVEGNGSSGATLKNSAIPPWTPIRVTPGKPSIWTRLILLFPGSFSIFTFDKCANRPITLSFCSRALSLRVTFLSPQSSSP